MFDKYIDSIKQVKFRCYDIWLGECMSISVNSMRRDELEPLAKQLLTKEIENKISENTASVKADVKGDTVTISEEGRALSQDKEKSGAGFKQGSEKAEESKTTDQTDQTDKTGKADKSEKGGKAEGGAGAEETAGSQSEVDKLIEKLKKKIKIVEQSIQELSSSNMPDDVKQALLGAKNEQLSLLNNQLQQMMEQKTKATK
ncbi:hypothetical protein [Halodesulfovibrio sp. MK-HDV]|uniref:hypothetical protein n=1 Tax=Halodesulfovibrio sp. MK-HDV TaxID=2599925 RepID=UPI00136CC9EB|nr:hypothetical protein [Halodesulfovibrio sp. MK-HDV]